MTEDVDIDLLPPGYSGMVPNYEEPLDILHPLSSLEWDELPPLPVGLQEAQIVYLKGAVYVGGGSVHNINNVTTLFSLRPGVDSTWTVTNTPTSHYALVIHDSQLLLVGGMNLSQQTTNKIYTLDLNSRNFEEILPPMKKKRSQPSALSTGSALIVAGGYDTSEKPLSSVELYSYQDGKWTIRYCLSLPKQCAGMNSAFNGEFWALGTRNTVYRASLESLIFATDQSPCEWETLPGPPSFDASITYFGGCLVCVGGIKERVFGFSTHSHSWVNVADLPDDFKVWLSCVIGLPSANLIAIGQNIGEYGYSRRVLRAHIKVSLVDPDVQFSASILFTLDTYGINLIKTLAKNPLDFGAAAGVQLPTDDLSLEGKDYVRKIFECWERSNEQPTYPATWEGLFTVLRKMNLGQLVEKIAKCVTGSVPEETHREKGVDIEEMREVLHKLLEEKNEELTKEIRQLQCENSQLKEENSQLRHENSHLKLNSQILELPDDHWGKQNLPGVEVVRQTSLIVTNSDQSFHWAGYGFKLHIPQDSLPAGVDQCQLDIIVSVAGQYQLPGNHQFFSAVCWVRPNPICRFRNKLTIEMQHCAKSTKLYFVRADCSQGVPYTFKKLEGRGFVSEQSSYALLQVYHFCGLAVAGEKDVPRFYTASTFYLTQSSTTTVIHLAVTPNVEANTKAIERYYRKIRARKGAYISAFELVGDSKEISLDVPLPPGLTIGDCWRLYSMVTPILTKGEIDVFIKDQSAIPAIQLKANLLNTKAITDLLYTLKLSGAKEPRNQLVLEITSNFSEERVHMDSTSAIVPCSKRDMSSAFPIVHHRMSPGALHAGPSRLSLEQSHTSLTLSPATHAPPPHWALQAQDYLPTNAGYSHSKVAGDLIYGLAGAASGSARAIEYPTVTLDQLVDHVGIDKDLLNTECTENSLRKVAPLLPYWASYAKSLGFAESQIQDVLLSHHLSTEMKALRVLEMWHERYGFNATYRRLVEVCLSLRHVSVATEICKALKEEHPSEDSFRLALTGKKRRQEEVTEHTEEEQEICC